MNPEPPPVDPVRAVPPPLPPPTPAPRRAEFPPWLAILLGLVVLAGLAGVVIRTAGSIARRTDEAGGGGGISTASTKRRPPPAPLTPAQREKLKEFGDTLAGRLSESDSDGVKALLDTRELAVRVFGDLFEDRQARSIVRGFEQGANQRAGGWMWAVMGRQVRCLRVRERDGWPVVQLRIRMEDGGVNYAEVVVRPEGDGFRAVDLYTFMFGSYASDEARNIIAAMGLRSGQENLMSRLMGLSGRDRELESALSKMVLATQEGRPQDVRRAYTALPEKHRRNRACFMFNLQALMLLGDSSGGIEEDYKKALQEAPSILGPDSTTDLLLLDLQVMEGRLDEAEQGLRRIDRTIGGDAYLMRLIAGLALKRDDVEAAATLLREAEALEPELIELVDLKLEILARRKDGAGFVAELERFRERFGVTLGRRLLSENESFAGVLASPEFRAWEKDNPESKETPEAAPAAP